MASDAGVVPSLPNAAPLQVTPKITIQPPLSRRGTGPGLVLIVSSDLNLSSHEKTLDPPPLQKWAEESYAVAQIAIGRDASGLSGQIGVALAELQKLPECEGADKVGAIAHDSVITPKVDDTLLAAVSSSKIAAVIFYGCAPDTAPSLPALAHLPGGCAAGSPVKKHVYNGADTFFVIPAHEHYRASSAAVGHTRTLTFLKPLIGGPYFDLEEIWEEHTRLEFADRSVERTMATMVQEPYVNHVPTLTGGIGREKLTNFYGNHFIFSNPDDAALELVSRTVGIDRIVDEFLFNCTHDRVIDWLLPGVPPTGKKLSVPMTSIVNIRGDRLFHEHISWDQGTALRQLGLLPEYLPFPYPVEGAEGKKLEYRVPVAGHDTAKKLVNENAVESNGMIKFSVRECDQ
ncbi:carboxymethylenebutenolidase [Immersiella caudata]|uniref:Carboxymethylenebutenolidase n=1 Tax=Immersiella caudata TaxID=314043 RepID=A0AA39WSA3_9PEZI|nr:carboxymethylenebutenolidase [Immersiella caudata]